MMGHCTIENGNWNSWRLRAATLAALAMAGFTAPGFAADPPPDAPVMTDQQILQALHPPRPHGFKTRGLSRMPAPGEAEAPVAATQAAGPQSAAGQSVNLNIPFERNSSTLQPQAATQLKQLGSALNSPMLGKDRFLVAGHTDAKGGAQYNKALSLKRAEAVKHFLVANGLDAGRLDTVGYGSEQLLLTDKPEDPSNRRVEIKDLGEAP